MLAPLVWERKYYSLTCEYKLYIWHCGADIMRETHNSHRIYVFVYLLLVKLSTCGFLFVKIMETFWLPAYVFILQIFTEIPAMTLWLVHISLCSGL